MADKKKDDDAEVEENVDTLRPLLLIFTIFSLSFGAMLFLYIKAPQLSVEDAEKVKLPRNLDDAKNLGRVISSYKDDYFPHVLLSFVLTYVFLQSFAIPGSIFLSILSGFLFPFPVALFLVCLCSAAGASFCYLLSSVVGRKLVRKYFPERIKKWKQQVDSHKVHFASFKLHFIIWISPSYYTDNCLIQIIWIFRQQFIQLIGMSCTFTFTLTHISG